MENTQQVPSGFSSHVQGQLLDAINNVSTPQRGRGRGQNKRGRGQYQPFDQFMNQQAAQSYTNAPQNFQQPTPQPNWNNQVMNHPTNATPFPPSGDDHVSGYNTSQPQFHSTPPQQSFQPQHNNYHHSRVAPPQNHSFRGDYERGRGGPARGRGRGHHQAGFQNQHQNQFNHHAHQQNYHPNQPQPQSQPQFQHQPPNQYRSRNPNDFHRPNPTQKRLFTPANQQQFNTLEEQRAYQHKIMDQADFLNHLANQSLKNQLTTEEQQAKECFRKELEATAQKVIAAAITDEMKLKPEHVRLKLYGSLGSGFAVAGSDMDLLLAFPKDEGPLGDIEIESRRLLEKALLDAGIGARLLTNTRVPILRVCQSPSAELLKNLRDYRSAWELEEETKTSTPADNKAAPLPALTNVQLERAAEALANLDLEAHNVPLPDSPTIEPSKLEFTGDCGIQCDINFTNHVALHNTRLLKTYGLCDTRVRQVGVFVKKWAKARDINTPYRGTLSSYGYILMVLHYLMNIANPPVIPNLQELAREKDSWKECPENHLVDGFDVRFVRNVDEVQKIVSDMPRNNETVGALLRGFFWYYTDLRGFHWQHDVVSIQSRNGQLTKRSKGWTEAKWQENRERVRLRYLLAIEDPFELEHNVARTVGHSGIVAIRDEFRKAWSTIEKIEHDRETKEWFWLNQNGEKISGDDMIAVRTGRGDLLRKDQDYHRQKVRQLRQDLEAKEKALQNTVNEAESVDTTGINGTSEVNSQIVAQHLEQSNTPQATSLINGVGFQVETQQQHQSWGVTTLENEYQEEQSWEVSATKTTTIDWDKPFNETEIHIEEGWIVPVTNDINVDGNKLSPDADQPDQTWQEMTSGHEDEVQSGWNASRASSKEIDWSQPFSEAEVQMEPELNVQVPPVNDLDRSQSSENEQQNQSKQATFTEHGKPKEASWDAPVATTNEIDWNEPFSELEQQNRSVREAPSNGRHQVPTSWNTHATSYNETSLSESFHWTGAPTNTQWVDGSADQHDAQVRDNKWHTQPNDHWETTVDNEVQPTHATNKVQQKQNVPGPTNNDIDQHESVDGRLLRSYSIEDVDVVIEWTTKSPAGRWLRHRDSLARDGLWKPKASSGMYRKLDRNFPYNPDMTVTELAIKNKILLSLYRHSMHPIDPSKAKTASESNVPSASNQDTKLSMMSGNDQQPALEIQDQTSKAPPAQQGESDVSQKKKRKNLGKQRRAQNKARKNVVDDTDSKQPSEYISQGINDEISPQRSNPSSNTYPTNPPQTNSQPTTNSALKPPFQNPSPNSIHNKPTTSQSTSRTRNLSIPYPRTAQFIVQAQKIAAAYNFPPHPPQPPTTTSLVPLTLYPDTPRDERPRDEDPDIMPIPRKPGFRFDPRQLADLDVIRRGGNGCARAGLEFEIEEDYEFGGGGQMGCDPVWFVEKERKDESGEEKKEKGRGDEEGLLKELPGSVCDVGSLT